MGYMGMCGPKGYVFSVILVINRLLHLNFSVDMGMFIRRSHFFYHYRKENNNNNNNNFIIIYTKINKSPSQKPFTNYVYSNLTLVWTREQIVMQVSNRVSFNVQVINSVSNFWSGHKKGREIIEILGSWPHTTPNFSGVPLAWVESFLLFSKIEICSENQHKFMSFEDAKSF